MKKALVGAIISSLIFVGCAVKESENIESKQEKEKVSTPVEKMQSVSFSTDRGTGIQSEEEKGKNKEKIANVKFETIYFDFDKYNIRASEVEKLEKDYEVLKSNSSIRVRLEGNCDEWGSDEYNYALGLKRAKSVKDALVAKGIDPSRLDIVSYGEANPVCMEHTRECWQKNRRVEFKIIK